MTNSFSRIEINFSSAWPTESPLFSNSKMEDNYKSLIGQ